MTPVIFETDMTFDVDDVGALAMLHALADRGEADILGVVFNEVHPHGVQAIYTLNSWYGRSNIPIARFTGDLSNPDESRYLESLARMSDNTASPTVLDCVAFYRETLAHQPDQSVTIVSVGFFNSLAELLRAEYELVKRKVLKLVAMGGLVNDNFNFVRHDLVKQTQFVIETWPTPLVVTDFGGRLYTGETLKSADAANPVREAYFRWFDGAYKGRSSWDQIAVLVGVRDTTGKFEFISNRSGKLRNGYEWRLDGNHRTYAQPTEPPEYYAQEIEKLMTVPPVNRE